MMKEIFNTIDNELNLFDNLFETGIAWCADWNANREAVDFTGLKENTMNDFLEANGYKYDEKDIVINDNVSITFEVNVDYDENEYGYDEIQYLEFTATIYLDDKFVRDIKVFYLP